MITNELKSLLFRFHIKPDKRLGQNFLLSEKVLDEIVAAAELKLDDTVLEIGPGLGMLTRRLGERAGLVLAVEKDRKLVAALRKIFKNKKNVKIILGDALFLNASSVVGQRGAWRQASDVEREPIRAAPPDNAQRFKVVANLPYYITGKLLQNFLSPSPNPSPQGREIKNKFLPLEGGGEVGVSSRPSLMVLLLQKEVAQRIVAKPGQMSLLSVSVQFYADPEIMMIVPKDNFYPVPEVDSAVVRLKVLDKPRFDVDVKKFFQLVKIGFSNKRKMLKNNLEAGLKNIVIASDRRERGNLEIASSSLTPRNDRVTDYKQILSSLNLNPLARAQDLSLEEWEKLYRVLSS